MEISAAFLPPSKCVKNLKSKGELLLLLLSSYINCIEEKIYLEERIYLGFGLFLIDFCPYFLHLYPSSPIPLPKHLILRVYLFSILLKPLSNIEILKNKTRNMNGEFRKLNF